MCYDQLCIETVAVETPRLKLNTVNQVSTNICVKWHCVVAQWLHIVVFAYSLDWAISTIGVVGLPFSWYTLVGVLVDPTCVQHTVGRSTKRAKYHLG